MAFCTKCGTEIEENVNVCPNCGEAIGVQSEAPVQPEQTVEAQPTQTYNAQVEGDDQADIQNNKLFAILAYFGILVLIPILARKDSKFARFHANQGLILFIISVAVSVVFGIISGIISGVAVATLSTALLGLSTVVSAIQALFSIAIFVFEIMGIVNAATGKVKELPLIGKFKILK